MQVNIEDSVLKFFLGRILSSHTMQAAVEEESVMGPLQYNQHFKMLVEEVLAQDPSLGDSEPYVPIFYQSDAAAKVVKHD